MGSSLLKNKISPGFSTRSLSSTVTRRIIEASIVWLESFLSYSFTLEIRFLFST